MSGWGEDLRHWGLRETPYGSPNAPYKGSGIVMYDLGNPWGPHGNITPTEEAREHIPSKNKDPHRITRFFPEHQAQTIHFFETGGEIIDVCGGNGCHFTPMSGCAEPFGEGRENCWVDD